MPEYLAPGVYIEEVSYRAKTIEGVSTSTAGFIGPTRFGPTSGPPELLTSFADFERIFGGLDPLDLGGTEVTNYLAYGVKAFFDEGGRRLYVTRVVAHDETGEPEPGIASADVATVAYANSDDPVPPDAPPALTLKARFPGSGGELRANFIPKVGKSCLIAQALDPADPTATTPAVRGLSTYDAVWMNLDPETPGDIDTIVDEDGNIVDSEGASVQAGKYAFQTGALYWAERYLNTTTNAYTWRFHSEGEGSDDATVELADLVPGTHQVRPVTISVEVVFPGKFPRRQVWEGLGLHPEHSRSLSSTFAEELTNRTQHLTVPFWINGTSGVSGPNIARTLLGQARKGNDLARVEKLLELEDFSEGLDEAAEAAQDAADAAAAAATAAATAATAAAAAAATAQADATVAQTNFDNGVITQEQLDAALAAAAAAEAASATAAAASTAADEAAEAAAEAAADAAATAAAAIDLSVLATLVAAGLSDGDRVASFELELASDASDGTWPTAGDYQGDENDDPNLQSGLYAFEQIPDISIVAAPGYTYGFGVSPTGDANVKQRMRNLIAHAEKMRYRIAVIESPAALALSSVREFRGEIDSTHAALYYPWITIFDPINARELSLPPSGFVAGIYARNDVEKGVHKAPANEVVRSAIGFEVRLNKAHQDVLNPEGINCFRFFEGRGYRLWGARTATSDAEWKYVNLRRYFAFLERSIERGTQFIVFENNNSELWGKTRRLIEDFLFSEWKSGHLLGDKPQEAYFVRCDRSTMTQNDLDNGRLICLVGVSPVRPAEYVIFRIGQWTADQKS